MRVLVASARGIAGGGQVVTASLVRQLRARGYEADLVVSEKGPLAGWVEEVGGRAWVLDEPVLDRWRPTARAAAEMERIVRAQRPDVVVGACSSGHVLGGRAAARAGIPAVWWRMLTARGRPHERAAAKLPVAAVACPTRAAMRDQRALTPAAPCWHVPLGVPTARLAVLRGSGAAVRRELGWEGCRIVGMVGRIDPAKGQDVFLRAAARVAARFEDVRFLLVGGALVGHEGSFPAEVERLAVELGLESRLAATGFVEDAIPYIDALDVTVNASAHEAFGLQLVEAMALGVPVVATRTQGPREVLAEGRHGLLVEPGDEIALADEVSRLLANRELAGRLSAQGRARAEELTEDAMGERFAQRLAGVAGGRAASAAAAIGG